MPAPGGPQTNGKAHKSLKVRLRQAIVTNPCDNRRFIPCQQLENICHEQTVAQELAKAFPEDLPFSSNPDLTRLYSHRPNSGSGLTFPNEEDQYEVIEDFLEKQWSVLVPSFEAPEAGNKRCNVYKLHDKTILPIQEVSKKKYPGGFGLVEKVKIHKEHNGFPQNHEYFALKTMHPMIPDERDRFFQQELDAFHKARPGGHIIEIRAAFMKGESRGFLFPWADGGTLNHLWAKDPHKIVSDAGVPWSEFSRWICIQCHGIIRDLWAIHEPFGIHVPAGTSAEDLYGIHSDIKPDNILHFTEKNGAPLGLLKVSDLGLMKFHRLVSRTVQSKSMGNAYQTYRAPEHDMGKVRSRKIDIWAFGCLFAEFVTWAIGGENAIELFKTARIDEDKRFPDENKGEWSEDNFFIMKTSRLTQVKAPKRKGTVDEWFSDLTKDLGPDMANTFFPQFLRFIQSAMLDPDRKHRADSKQVETFLGRLLQQNPPDSPYWHFNGTVEYPKAYSRSTTGTGTW
ncbi:protein kinase domain-containing protein [Trichoderma breve]|uniref:Protein kinase domain-containing protein n=1 Tax=Trichoderma breve TaxID=2034170 RepID=A0A9W9B2U4_9HYPO|nr:protein kinase domain-containing protein [Trichoderma breve]KAJ4854267.1 protein kinase domain-containing protein [Trichoderma breve]